MRLSAWRALLLAALPSACTVLEYDRMVDTAFPADIERDGATWDLERIWDSAGLWLYESRNDVDIPAGELLAVDLALHITDPDVISFPRIEAIGKAWRSTDVEPTDFLWLRIYHVQGLVVQQYYTDSTSFAVHTKVLGAMLDFAERKVFANFYANSYIDRESEYFLRSAAHELGHAFNLRHEDSDGLSILSETGGIDPYWTFEFSSASLDHLTTHKEETVYPGMGPFDADHTGH